MNMLDSPTEQAFCGRDPRPFSSDFSMSGSSPGRPAEDSHGRLPVPESITAAESEGDPFSRTVPWTVCMVAPAICNMCLLRSSYSFMNNAVTA